MNKDDVFAALDRLENDALASRDGYGDARKDAEIIRASLTAKQAPAPKAGEDDCIDDLSAECIHGIHPNQCITCNVPRNEMGYFVWHDGTPPKMYGEEWFIAKTTYGDKVVLRLLPEEYSYQYTTADYTYIKADKIAKWMQFSDSQYKPYKEKETPPTPPNVTKQLVEALVKLKPYLDRSMKRLEERKRRTRIASLESHDFYCAMYYAIEALAAAEKEGV